MAQTQRKSESSEQNEQQSGPSFGGGRTLLYVLAAIALFTFFFPFSDEPGTQVPYSTFKQQLSSGNVQEVTLQGNEVRGTFVEPIEQGEGESANEVERFTTFVPTFGDPSILETLNAQEVTVNTVPQASGFWSSLLISFLPILLFIGLGIWFFRRMRSQQGGQGGLFSVGKSKAKLYDKEEAETTFDDVAGTEGAKRELQETVEFLKNPDQFESLGGEMPKGILLVGPPGTGKTLLAKAVAGEADVPFFSTSGSDFMEMLVGVGASRVRDMFKEAKEASPCIIFIDELDSIGRQRGAGLGGGNDEREQTLNQLLNEMDGFEAHENVIVMAATNRPDVLDQALLRPGRFDRQITVDAPNKQSRLEILHIHARNKPLADNVDLEEIARSTPGLSGADLENLLNEAALVAARQGKEEIEREDIQAARDKVFLGREREGLALTDEDKELIAYHEAGHTVVAATLPNTDPIEKVSIVPRGRTMGVTQQIPEREKYIYKREYMLDRLAVMMGGRAAEDVVLHTATSGAANDFQQATKLARRMVTEMGLSERLGPISFNPNEGQVFLGQDIAQSKDYSEITGREIDEEIKRFLEEAYARAVEALKENRDGLGRLARALIEDEVVQGDRVMELLEPNKVRVVAD